MVKGLDQMVQKLKANGVEFVAAPSDLAGLARPARFVCVYDPDGIIVELVELF
jgi:catechol 2,3-dioxygenase-like lactoylglutathione lyase family enzyme